MAAKKPKVKMEKLFNDFMGMCLRRLVMGREMFGDASFHKHPDELLNEVTEELADVCCWAFILWVRVEKIRGDLVRRANRQEDDKRGRKVGTKGKSVI
jgi:hypothetical protein